MINYWHGAVGEIKAYNDSIDKGAVKGQKADFPVVLLPWPYDPENGANPSVATTNATLQNTASGTSAMIQCSTMMISSNPISTASSTLALRSSLSLRAASPNQMA